MKIKNTLMKPLLISLSCLFASASYAQIGLSINIDVAPPALPIYAQPAMPEDGYMWTPGYWSWDRDNNDYYWVPGTWVATPYSGALWTPGYWGYNEGRYAWNAGYWGDHIGYYGGINYGYGYTGAGYQGGYWNNGAFAYNRSVNNVGNVHVNNTYSSRVNVVQNTRVSFNGGDHGVHMTASKNEQIINSMPHQRATAPQSQHENDAKGQPNQRLSVNHGLPPVAATQRPSSFDTRAEPARAEPAQRQQSHPTQRPDNHPPQASAPAPKPNQQQHEQPQQREQPQQHEQPQQRQQPQQRSENRPAPGEKEEHR